MQFGRSFYLPRHILYSTIDTKTHFFLFIRLAIDKIAVNTYLPAINLQYGRMKRLQFIQCSVFLLAIIFQLNCQRLLILILVKFNQKCVRCLNKNESDCKKKAQSKAPY